LVGGYKPIDWGQMPEYLALQKTRVIILKLAEEVHFRRECLPQLYCKASSTGVFVFCYFSSQPIIIIKITPKRTYHVREVKCLWTIEELVKKRLEACKSIM